MSKRLISVLIFAFIVSAGASLLLYRLVSSRMNTEAKQPTAQIMVAARSLPVGTMIGEIDIKMGAWSGPLPVNAVTKKEDAVGRGVIANIYEGEPLLESRLATKGAGAGLAATIPEGMRAVAIRVNEVVGVAGFVVPGQRVDVLVLGQPPGGGGSGTMAKTILQNIEVLSAGQNIQKDSEGKPVTVQVVNVLVTPEQAETLSLISNDMRIQLVLRNPLDTKEVKTLGAAAINVFTGAPMKAPSGPEGEKRAAARPRVTRPAIPPPPPVLPKRETVPVVVEVIHGTRRAEQKFKEAEKKEDEQNQ
jgi:pilus assembly protein CpaB